MFRVKKSIPVEPDLQGYIHFASRMYRKLDNKGQKRVRDLCEQAGGEYHQALFEFVTTDAGAVAVCRKHYISQSTLERIVKDLASPVEFEEAVRAINPELMDLDPAYSANLKQWFEAVGYTCVNKPSYNAETLQEMYDALANGALVVACVDDGTIGDGELHAILFYGINDSGELLVVDPSSFRGEGFGVYDCVPFTMLFQNIPQDTINAGCLIVSKN